MIQTTIAGSLPKPSWLAEPEKLWAGWRQYEEFFAALNSGCIDQVSLECAGSHVPLSVMSALKHKEVLVGAINVATTQVETPETVAATLRAALEFVDPERLIACTNCGMAPLPRNVAEGKPHALGAGAEIIRNELSGRQISGAKPL